MRDTERIAVGTLLFGPGERLTDLMTLVEASAPGAPVRQIADLDELVERRSDEGVLLVDVDSLPAEDVGYLRRFLAREDEFQVTLVGEDSSRRVARSLLRLPRVQWLSWPPDLDDVRSLAAPVRAAALALSAPPHPPPAMAPPPPARAHPPPVRVHPPPRPAVEGPAAVRSATSAGTSSVPSDELAQIEAILDQPDMAEAADATPEGERGSRTTPAGAQAPGPPSYFRDQVADLADIAQRIEGGLANLRETEREPGGAENTQVDAISTDVARLIQFTRTLSYLSAAPPRGDQVFDLAELVETLVAGLPKKGPKTPRWLARSSGPLTVHSDRELLLQVFDALLFVAENCSARGEIVRVQASEAKEAGPRRARVTIDFSDGPLAKFEPAQVIEPYGIRRVLPDLGPNALSAARGIVTGQGGALELEKSARGRLTWIVDLPLAAGPLAASASGPQRKRQTAPESGGPGNAARGASDPFA